MKLAALIQKGGLDRLASANPANSANERGHGSGTLATLATLALANPQKASNDSACPSPSSDSEAELRRLVNQIADVHGFSPEDRAEALTYAVRDPDRNRALTCFRALAAECSGTVH